MLALAFLNPLLLWGVPLCAVPIIIHLLNRRRFKVVKWAAMEYLLSALKRNRKRLRMEQWLVLLLRTLAVLFLILLVARPQPGGALLGARTHHVVLLDDSSSMQQRSGSTHLFDKAQDKIRGLADRLAQTRSGDLFSVVRTSNPGKPDLWGQRIGNDLGTRAGQLLKEMSLDHPSMDLAEVLKLTRKRASETKDAGRTEYYLVTDLRTYDWATDDDKPRAALAAEIAAIDKSRERCHVQPVSGRDAENVGITAVRHQDRLAVVGVQTTLAVDVQNFGLDPATPSEIAVEVDGKSRVVRAVPQLAPGEKTTLAVTHTFFAAGFHQVEAALGTGDHYTPDDRRSLAVEVVERSRVLLVDGEPEGENGEGDTFFLSVALEPGGDAISGIEPAVITDTALAEADLTGIDVVLLCNAVCPSEAVVQKLEQYVASGGGLAIFAGTLVDTNRWNELFYKTGKGLLPLAWGDVAGDPDRPDHMALAKKDHPMVSRFPDLMEVLINRTILVKRHLPMVETPADTASVLARLSGNEGAPLIASKTYGNGGGQVVQFSITADKHWSNWPDTPAYVTLLGELHKFAAKVHDTAANNLTTASSLRLTIDPGRYKADVTVRALSGDGEERTFTAVAPPAPAAPTAPTPTAPTAEGQKDAAPSLLQLIVPMSELRTLGAFEIELRSHGDEVEKRLFTRSAPSEESRLLRFLPDTYRRLYPPDLQDRIDFLDENSSLGGSAGEGEIWRWLAGALLLGLLLESVLAWRFGRR